MDEELLLPRATLTKMIKEHIPPDQMRVSGEVISLIVDCCSEFVKRVYTQANDICTGDKKATIVADHVLRALERLALHDWLPNLEAALADFKDSTKSTKSTKPSNMTDAEMEQQQQRMLAEARERSLNASLATLPSADLGAALGLPMSATAATGVAGATLGDVAAQHSADMLDAMAQAQAGPGAGLQQAAMHEEAGAAVAAEAGADVAGVGPPQLAGTAPTQDG